MTWGQETLRQPPPHSPKALPLAREKGLPLWLLLVEPERGWDLAPVSPTPNWAGDAAGGGCGQALGSGSSPLLQSLSRTRTVNSSGVISWAQALVA